MKYEGYTTFRTEHDDGILTVTFDFGTVNVQGQEMLADLNSLAMGLEGELTDRTATIPSSKVRTAYPESLTIISSLSTGL